MPSIDAMNIETVRVIYLTSSQINAQFQSNLLAINPIAQFYTNDQSCMEYIQSIPHEQIFFILSNISSMNILETIHSCRSIRAMFIYTNQKIEDLKRQYSKLIDQYTDEKDLLNSIQSKIQLIETQIFAYSLFDPQKNFSRNFTKQSASFLWHQLLLHILQQLPDNPSIPDEIFTHHLNTYELEQLQLFHENYTSDQAIEWYSKECCLSKLLNHAFRTKNFQLLYTFRFYLRDLSLQIAKQSENHGKFIVYRTQIMSEEEITRWKENLGCLLSIHSFFLATKEKNLLQDSLIINANVLLKIHVNHSITLTDISSFRSTPAILFNINSLFQIQSVEYDFDHHFWTIQLITMDQQTINIQDYFQLMQKEMNYPNLLIYFGHLLWNELGEIDQGEKYFHILLKSFDNDHQDLPSIYNELGKMNEKRGEYPLALKNYQDQLEIYQKQRLEDYSSIALVMNQMGRVYQQMRNIDRAMEFYHQALAMEQQISPNDHVNKANILRNLALIYRDQQDWTNALNYFNQTLTMHQRLLINFSPPDLAICYGDIGSIYEKMNNLSLAFDSYQKQYEIEEECLPIDHPNLHHHFENLINILKKQDQIDQAIDFCQKKLFQLKIRSKNHPRIVRILVLLATLNEDKNPKAADHHYQQALMLLEEQKTAENFSKSLSMMTNFYWKCRMFDRALICQMKLLQFRQLTLTSHDKDIAYTLRSLARLYRAMNKSTEALEYFEQSLVILEKIDGSEHIDVRSIQEEIRDLKEIIKSISSSAKEDYNYRRTSNAHKQYGFQSKANQISNKASTAVLKSSMCIIL